MNFKQYFTERKIVVIPRRNFGDKNSQRDINKKTGKPERYVKPSKFFSQFPIKEYDREGAYFDIFSQERLNGKVFKNGFIDTTERSPIFETDDEEVEFIKKGSTTKTNLVKASKYNWLTENPNHQGKFIVSVEQGDHYYSLKLVFKNPIKLSVNPDSSHEPRLRPVSSGVLNFGNVVGQIKIKGGNQHPCYDVITIG